MNQLLDELSRRRKEYYPNEEIQDGLRPKTAVPIIGPFVTGKSACIKYIAERYEGFGEVVSFTTREQRNGERPEDYHFLPHNEETWQGLLAKVQKRELVQFLPHSTTGFIYGTELSAYGAKYNMLAVLSTGIDDLRRLPFERIVEMTLVAHSDEWLPRFKVRRTEIAEADVHKRLREGVQSLEWSLKQDHMIWICNWNGRLPETCQEIVELVQGQREPNPANRKIGEGLLRTIEAQTA